MTDRIERIRARLRGPNPNLPRRSGEYAEDVAYLLQELDQANAEINALSQDRHLDPQSEVDRLEMLLMSNRERSRRADGEIEHLEKVIDNVERERDEARERVRALEKEAALDLDAMRDALATMKQQRELVDRLYAEAKGWHDQVSIDKETLGRVEEWADRIVSYDDGSMTVSVLESAAREVLSIIRGGGE